MLKLKNKVVVVTGASMGLSEADARKLAQEMGVYPRILPTQPFF